MARSPKYWHDVIIAEKNSFANLNAYQPNIDSSQTLLADLTTTSKVAIWRLIFWCCACAAYALDVVFDMFQIKMEGLVAASRYGTLPWYVTIAKEFQYGDALSLIDNEWTYAVLDETKQIIDLAAAQDGLGIVNVKIATISGSTPAPVGVSEYAAFVSYINKKKPAGITVNVINDVADDLKLYITVNFDPQVLTSTGELISSPGTKPVEDAINSYLNSFGSDSKFNSGFELMACLDAIQAAEGKCVISAYVTNAEARYGANPFVAFDQRYFPNAGYLQIHSGTPLSASITYVPYV